MSVTLQTREASAGVDRPDDPVAQALDRSGTVTMVLEPAPSSRTGLVIVSANASFRRVFGYAEGELRGRSFDVIATPLGDDATVARMAAAAAGGTALQAELRAVARDGTARWLGMQLIPVDAEAGRVRFVLLGQDITRKLQSDLEQQSVQRLLAAVFVSVATAVMIIDAAERVRMINPAFTRLLGYAADEVSGRPHSELIAEPDREPARAAHRGLFDRATHADDADSRSAVETTVRLLTRTGSELPLLLQSSIVELPDGQRFRVTTLQPLPEAGTAGRHGMIAGQIRMVGLDEVRQALGPRWAPLAERAMASAEGVLRRGLGPGEVFSRTADGFVIRFADRTEADASFRAAQLAREIRDRLIGQGEDLSVSSVSAIAASIETEPADFDDGTGSGPLMDVLNKHLTTRRTEIEAEARRVLERELSQAACRLDPVLTLQPVDGPQPVPIVALSLPEPASRRILAASGALADTADLVDLNAMLLTLSGQRITRDLLREGEAGRPPVINSYVVPVGFEVFAVRRRAQAFLSVCRGLEEPVRRKLVLLLREVPQGLTAMRAQEVVRSLAPFSKGIGIEIDIGQGLPFELTQTAMRLIAVPTASLLAEAAVREKTVVRLLAAMHQQKARILARQADDPQDWPRLRALGVDLISRTGSATIPAAGA